MLNSSPIIIFLLSISFLPATEHSKYDGQINREFLKSRIELMMGLTGEEKSDMFTYLLLGTAAVESDMGSNLGSGKYDVGVYQINKSTYIDIKKRVLPRHKNIQELVYKYIDVYGEERCIHLIEYQILLAMVYYKERTNRDFDREVIIEKITEDQIWSLAWYWKTMYNSRLGKGKTEHFYKKFKKYILKEGEI